MNPEEFQRLDTLQKKLYSRKHSLEYVDKREPVSHADYEVKEEWMGEEKPPESRQEGDAPPRKSSFFRKLLIVSLLFFIFSSGLALFIFYGGFNIISSRNVDIEIAGPVSVSGGEPLSLEVTVKNQNNVDLELANLIVEFPEGTRDAADINKELIRHREEIGALASGKSVKTIVTALLFGEEHSRKSIKATLEYRITGSNSVFFKEKTYEILLSAPPVAVRINSLNEVNSGQEFDSEVEISSNTNTTLENILLAIDYPFGYEYRDATPRPAYDNSIWLIKSLAPGEKKTIKLKGRIQGQDGEERTLRFTVGTQNTESEKEIKTAFATQLHSVEIKRPFVNVNLVINRETASEVVVPPNVSQRVQAVIEWKNNLPHRVTNVEIRARIDSTYIDRSKVSSGSGFYQSIDNTVVWDQRAVPGLAVLEPGATGSVSFSFSFDRSAFSARNPLVTLEVDIKGRRMSESGVPETITASNSKRIKISTTLGIQSKALYSSGPFQNSGPIPPKAETPTTYTVVWSVTNSANNVSQATLSSVLPPYVRWLGAVHPTTENVTYDTLTNRVIWQAGSIAAGTGTVQPAREVAFQVELLPSVSQIDTTPNLTGPVYASARDLFTNTTVETTIDPVTSELKSDPQYGGANTRVQR